MNFATFSERTATRMIEAFDCAEYRIGFWKEQENGRPDWQQNEWTTKQVLAKLPFLRKKNADGWSINIQPVSSAWTVVDDLTLDAIHKMQAEGFAPAIVVMTSPGNYQAWLRHAKEIKDVELARLVAKDLAARFGGDPSSAACKHFGKLGGFSNRKQKYCKDGFYPRVTLLISTGAVYAKTAAYVKRMAAQLEQEQVERRNRVILAERSGTTLTIDYFRSKLGDLHRADRAFAVHALGCGVPIPEIRAAIESRDLSKKDRGYVERTIRGAEKWLAANVRRSA